MRVALWLGAVTVAATGCASAGSDLAPSSSAAPAPVVGPSTALPPGSGLPPLVAQHGELALNLATRLRTAKSCGDVADVVDGYVEKHRGELGPATAAVIAWERTATPDELKAYYRNVFPAIEVRIDAGERCEKHSGARRAFERFFTATGLD